MDLDGINFLRWFIYILPNGPRCLRYGKVMILIVEKEVPGIFMYTWFSGENENNPTISGIYQVRLDKKLI